MNPELVIIPRPAQDKVALPANHPTVYATRDSTIQGELGDVVDLWLERPTRFPIDLEAGACWLNTDEQNYNQMYLGPYTLSAIVKWRGTIPDNDRECIVYG